MSFKITDKYWRYTNISRLCQQLQVGARLRTDEKIGAEYSLSKNTISRYLRIQHLTPRLKAQLDVGGIAFIAAVSLSFLKGAEQTILADCMEQYELTVDMKKADMLRKQSEKDRLGTDAIKRILTGADAHKPDRTPRSR